MKEDGRGKKEGRKRKRNRKKGRSNKKIQRRRRRRRRKRGGISLYIIRYKGKNIGFREGQSDAVRDEGL